MFHYVASYKECQYDYVNFPNIRILCSLPHTNNSMQSFANDVTFPVIKIGSLPLTLTCVSIHVECCLTTSSSISLYNCRPLRRDLTQNSSFSLPLVGRTLFAGIDHQGPQRTSPPVKTSTEVALHRVCRLLHFLR